ncbi:3-methyladenine DNA glycosylase/8-oxoguanine DNA glycosylase [Cyclonatronum proteinivorum]|uniref:3-methyladenine DNA glycosylase/8-oxoguanine DNA glycosylase n=1 Tax=Cyclonatronum proteinivorum TaxID=1457365 RepID=A0A345UMR6_9BACT|nr:hypothetical protein [Cyclonatronum proteinivorum]AXJ01768.1 3-methyladenine DNA glycosylase/8-oxoguanine DNA glycosylase [Cyclonatronum proteinivorum]
MPFSWKLKSVAPHDFFISLDIDAYFDHEHEPAEIPEKGMLRPLSLTHTDALVRIYFNGDPENPSFQIECEEHLSEDEVAEANRQLARILGTDIDLNPLYEKAWDDPILGPLFKESYGFKRMSRASFFEDALNRIIIAQISHKPTARRMVYGVREQYGTRLESKFGRLSAWPRPYQLVGAEPASLKKHGLSLRKGEYVTGLAHLLVSGEIPSQYEIENLLPAAFYELMLGIRGIGPTTAQDLMMFRNRTDAVFPSHVQKGEEKGLRRWISLSYGCDPDNTDESQFQELIRSWQGYESVALEYLHLNYVLGEKARRMKKQSV